VVFDAQNVSAANEYLAPDYVQHNPLVATGRDGFVKYFSAKWKAPLPVQPALKNPPAEVLAEGDLVTLMWKVKRPEPSDKSKTYDSYWFDMFRIKDGKLVEHWDNALK
jgi:predicted SnoaL-like aldol condensation-catalyzing enzyme